MVSGRVVDAAGNGVAGVTVSAIGRDAAAGTTATDANGWYRFAVEGGEPVTLKFAQTGIASVLRIVETRWGSRERLADVVTPPLEAAMNVTLPAAGGSAVVVAAQLHGVAGATGNKPRRARLIIPPGTTITNAPGLTNVNVRMTEMTDGPKEAMPLDLPSSIGFTYATDYTIEELPNGVQWSQPVFAYVDNFLDVPVGTEVPLGYVDEAAGRWVSELRNVCGTSSADVPRVIKVVSVDASGLATVDAGLNGMGQPNVVNMSAAELRALGGGASEAPPEPITISQSGYAARLSSSVFLNCNSNSMGLT
jgi:hypothetical protein